MNAHENHPANAHDSWADCNDCVYKLTYGNVYRQCTDLTLRMIRDLAAPPAQIADYGAGTGRLAIPLAKLGYHVTAVEASAQMCRVLRTKAAAGAEGAGSRYCACSGTNPSPTTKQPRLKVAVANQTICQPLKKGGFDLGLCVFTVLNYLLEDVDLRQFASAAARAIRVDGKLLVSFVEDMRLMQQSLNGQNVHQSWNRNCSLVRNINILQLDGILYEYQEASNLTKNGRESPYEDRFPLREWSRGEVTAKLRSEGFFLESDLTTSFFRPTGEVYLLFRRASAQEMLAEASSSHRGESPNGFLRKLAAEGACRRRAQLLQARTSALKFIADGDSDGVFYYPACGSDLEYPLRHFSERCQTFVFCDWTPGAQESFLEAVTKLKAEREVAVRDKQPVFLHFPLAPSDLKDLAVLHGLLVKSFPGMHPNLAAYVGSPASAKGHYAQLWITGADSKTRIVRVFWFTMEAVNLYSRLFAQKRKAPRILCIKTRCQNWDGWTRFGDWQAHLAKAVQDGPRKPRWLVAREGKHDWPWTLLVDRFEDWDFRADEPPVMMWARSRNNS